VGSAVDEDVEDIFVLADSVEKEEKRKTGGLQEGS
jgi:hypothetical protein